jgi:Ca2+-binding RTX toxin-like protein
MGNEFRVNTYEEDWQDEPVVTKLNDGGFVIAWRSYYFESSTYYVAAQRYDANGLPVGGELILDGVAGSASEIKGITTLKDGGIAISFSYSPGGLLEPDETWVGVFNTDLSVRQAAFKVAGPSASIFQTLNSETIALNSGGFLVVWGVDGTVSNASIDFNDVFAQRYDANGTATGAAFRLNSTVAEFDQDNLDVTTLGNGQTLVTWHSEGSFPTPGVLDANEIRGTLFSSAGDIIRSDFSIAQANGTVGDGADPYAITSWGTTGGFALARYEVTLGTGGNPTTFDVDLQLFRNDGSLYNAAPIKVVQATTGIIYDIDITELATGEIVVVWQTPVSPLSQYSDDVQARIYDNKGKPLSAVFDVPQFRLDTQETPVITGLVDGGFVVSYMSEQADIDNDGIAGRVFGRGTTGDDVMTVSSINYLAGLAGADTLTGNASANRIFGGTGVDILDGKGGNDYLVGGVGQDVFKFSSALSATSNVDKLGSVTSGWDSISLSKSIFASIGSALTTSEFQLGTVADDANDYILYDKANGRLYYDADGSGAKAAVLFADLINGTTLRYTDFDMV